MIGKNGKRKELFSLDSFLGKALCVLLVLILTVGAFLAPKLISNLYDTGTLMQITYMDMDLSPYAVNYLTMEDKLQAIARVRTAGGSLSVLPAGEEASEAESDAELAEAVNREMDLLGPGISVLFMESWWTMLTEDNLVSRTKYTLYGRPEGGEGDTSQEMAPFQFWVLQFALMDEDTAGYVDIEGKNRYAVKYVEATDRLLVCMDADFYKIYAISFAGNEERINEMYGPVLGDISGMNGYAGAFTMSIEEKESMRIEIVEVLMDCWADYWGSAPYDRISYMDIESELLGAYIYQNAGAGDQDGAAGVDTVNEAVFYEGAEAPGNTVMGIEAAADVEEIMERELLQKGQMMLVVGAQGQRVWNEGDSAAFVQKIGCRDFFEMMQF